MDADDRGARLARGDGPAAADLRADAAARDHGQPLRQALHERGRELQRVRRRVPRAGHHHGRRTRTCPAGWSSTRPGSTGTASPAASAAPRRRRRTGSPSADTPEGLAEKLGIPADALKETIERFNANARDSRTRTSTAAGAPRTSGGATRRCATAPRAPRSGPVEDPPYYAIQVFSGALGTKGGPQTDTHARVLDLDGNVIEGLYAAGNAMASPWG